MTYSILDSQWYAPVGPAYRPDAHELVVLVRSPVADLAGLVSGLNERLARDGSGWRFQAEDPGDTHPLVTPLDLIYQQPDSGREPDADVHQLLPLLIRAGAPGWTDPLLLGSPAYKPHALTRGDLGRVPVDVLAEHPPVRRPSAGRRPVVALLDTAVAAHPWLSDDPAGDPVVVDARQLGWRPGRRLPETRTAAGRLDRPLGTQEGHGTFCAGLVRQVAPDARVLAVHVIADDGTVYGDHVLNALGWLLAGDHLAAGDVLCLPFGFRPAWPTDVTYLRWLGAVLGEFGQRGVAVVAAAGNEGESDPVYPAAFAVAPNPPATPLVSVGALNTNGRTPAQFSNFGTWVTTWEIGTSVVSAFPRVDGAGRAELAGTGDGTGESADPDDFTAGFARWSGTSFAATVHAARIAQRTATLSMDATVAQQ